jgi:RNA polymerase sigma-70 factor (ECF subfamily)
MPSRLMRRILVDTARRKGHQKRGGRVPKVSLSAALAVPHTSFQDFSELDDALNALEVIDGRKAKVIEMRFFGEMSVPETAAALHLSVGTIKNDWPPAKAWLARELGDSPRHDA